MINLSLEKKIQKQNVELKEVVNQLQKEIIERMQAEENLQSSFDKLSRVLEEAVNALASSVEKRDPYTYGHQRMVTQLACLIAKEMGLPENQIEGIRIAGSVHDIGKITVPSEILSKPGRLTEIELMLIKEHPNAGYDILKGIEFPWKVADFVLQHHERMDGSGYPQHLKGDNILLESRILGVADVVEAMSNHRPYRPARGLNKALDEIRKNRGVLYDPDVVDTCLNIFGSKKFEFGV
ncbi:MAG: HD domain-containing protein [Proteobacteria bacterium]|nr:HD domain-containing protein [Pseudomonadota bacterium]